MENKKKPRVASGVFGLENLFVSGFSLSAY
jgi:hypothetical protein